MNSEEMMMMIFKKMDKIDTRLDHLESDIGSMKSDIGSMKSDIGSMKSDIGYLKQKINFVNKKVDDLRIDIKFSQKAIQKDIAKLQDAQDTIIAVLEHQGILNVY